MPPAIRVAKLSKRYTLGARSHGYRTLRDTIADLCSAPLRYGRRLRRPSGKPAGSVPERHDKPQAAATIWSLKDVSFDIQPGEVTGIIGRNGAGKSTLLKIISRVTEPTSGRVELRGRVGSLLEVGTGFHPELTGRENIHLSAAILGMSRREIVRKFDEIVAFAEIEQFLETPVKRYSSGMYVRLAFSVAAHLEPEILLVDEVLAVGDAAFQEKCLGRMHDVAGGGRTVLFVSHNMAAIQQLCTRVIYLAAGSLRQHDRSEKVIPAYLAEASEAASGDFDLTNFRGRSAKHSPILQRLVVGSAVGNVSSHFHPEDSLYAEITVQPIKPILHPRLALTIEDSYGRRITTVASFFGKQPLAPMVKPTRVLCVLPRIGLGSGRYLVGLSIADNYDGMLDSVHGGGWFEVAWRNNYGNGEPYLPVYGPVLTDSTWEKLD